MSKRKTAIIAGLAAGATTAALALLCFKGHIGGEGPDTFGWIGLVLLFPAILIGASCGPAGAFVVPAVAVLQFFFIYWFIIRLLIKGRMAEPDAGGNSR